jgi:tyrosyl-tRNA synthetase
LLSVFEGVPQIDVTRSNYETAATVSDLLSEVTGGQIFESKGEAKRMIKNGGVSINRQKVQGTEDQVNYELLQQKYLVVQKGKKNYYLVTVN